MPATITDYDPIADRYRLAKQQPWRTHIEAFTLMALVGDPTGQAVLDVACGEGFYTRMIRQRGAATATGVDLSAGMVELARAQETRHRQVIDYRVGDACDLGGTGEYDLVVAAYLLNYAHDRAELGAMCAGIAGCLKPGGRLVAVNCNPALAFPAAPSYRKYGFEVDVTGAWREGTPIRWTFHLPDGSFAVENYHLGVAAHEEALAAAGFRSIRWHGPRLSPEGQATHGSDFWSGLMGQCPVAFLECVR
jgi:SAM-dependent methyltransferase